MSKNKNLTPNISMMMSTAEQFIISAKVLGVFRPTSATESFMPLFPVIVNSAFSAELFLKLIHYIEKNTIHNSHDLYFLYNKLSPKSMTQIASKMNDEHKMQTNQMIDLLKQMANSFERFRYFYEDSSGTFLIQISFLFSFCDACRDVIIALRPDLKMDIPIPNEFKYILNPI